MRSTDRLHHERAAGIPRLAMRGMRNRIAHGCFDVDINVVWNTVQQDSQPLLDKLPPAKP
jgi:uncharacterized protein with HEPN domain